MDYYGRRAGRGLSSFCVQNSAHSPGYRPDQNSAEGVSIEIQGNPVRLAHFEALFAAELPPLARIVSWTRQQRDLLDNESHFSIAASTGGPGHHVLISPDVATCDDCLADMRDPHNRRHAYPFTNCTNCGPRYTMPAPFPMTGPARPWPAFPSAPSVRLNTKIP